MATGYRILSLQNDRFTASKIESILAGETKVTTARDPADCQKQLLAGGYNLLLVDFDPNPDDAVRLLQGIELARGGDSPPVPVLAVTSPSSNTDTVLANQATLRRLGVVGVLDRKQLGWVLAPRIKTVLGWQKGPRQHKRSYFKVPVDYTFQGARFQAETFSLSVGGVFVAMEQADRQIPTNEMCQLTIRIRPDQPPLKLNAKVLYTVAPATPQRHHPAGVAFGFTELDDLQTGLLQKALEPLPPLA